MRIEDAQAEVRAVYRSGWIGQLISGLIWLASAVLATWISPQSGFAMLIFGGIFIFPLVTLVLKLMGGPTALSKPNTLNGLAMQVAFSLPLMIPVILWAAQNRAELFYPAFMIALGAHYLPFIFLYGMKQFAALAVLLVGIGAALGYTGFGTVTTGAWITAGLLIGFAIFVRLTMHAQPAAASGVRARQ